MKSPALEALERAKEQREDDLREEYFKGLNQGIESGIELGKNMIRSDLMKNASNEVEELLNRMKE